ncbi:Ras GTPase family protein [Metarhizium robertsii]|uniref:Ras GTPase family protein n=1 Tax=Metarhizium robertsii TaxID=568076 RepID=A0A014NE80_9HYPO|nr:Ras GTPase family protein [Metarhizium robertsii]
MAPDVVKEEVAENAATAVAARSPGKPRNETLSVSTRSQPLIFGEEWKLALDEAGTRQRPQPAAVIPKFVFGESSKAATASSPYLAGAIYAKTAAKTAGDNSSIETSTSRRDTTSSVTTPSFTFDIDPSALGEGAREANPPTSAETASSSPPIVYQFGSFRGLHNVTPVPSPKAEPFKLSDDYVFDFSLPSPKCPSPKAAFKIRSPRNSRPSSLSDLLGYSPSTQSGRPPAETGQSSTSEPILLLGNQSHSDLSRAVAGSQQPVVAYDVLNEETPRHPFFSNTFQATLQKGLRIAKAATDVLKSVRSVQGSGLDSLLKEGEDLCAFHGTSTRTIAILGDSGQGKSSLINSLLHFPRLAKTGDSGSACTSVVTEYRQKRPNQKDNILIEVEILSRSEIEEVLTDYLWKYRLFYNAEDNTELETEEHRICEADASQAWSALDTAFRHHQEFSKQFLQDDSSGAVERIKAKLVRWAEEIDWPDDVVDSVWRSSARDSRECFEMTRKFMGDKHWPFTKIIRVYINAQILKTGIVLADLPGLQDTNLARVKATQDYLMKCNSVFIVANISRAITDQSLKSSLFSVLSRHVPLELEESGAKALRIAVICTRAEDIDIENAKQEFCGPGNSVDLDECDKLESELEAARRTGDSAQKKRLKLKYGDFIPASTIRLFLTRPWCCRHRLLFIEARNQHVKRGLQSAYASKIPDQTLDVFCVSNKIYEKHVPKGNSEFVAASGIPELRRFCHTITADAQLQEATHFLKSSIPSFLTTLEIRLGSLCSGDEKLARFQQARNSIHRGLDEMVEASSGNMQPPLREKYGKSTLGIGVAQYDAWCCNNGHHATAGRDREDWNAKIIWKMRSELDFQWTVVEEEAEAGFCKLQKTLDGLFANLQAVLVDLMLGNDLSVLEYALSAQIHNVTYRIQRAKEGYAKEMSLTRRYASETNFTSFILQQMTDTYRHAAGQRGAGKSARQKAIVQGRITDNILFPTICALISDCTHSTLQNTRRELLEMMQASIGHVRSDFTCALGDENSDKRPICLTMESADLATLREALSTVKLLNLEAKVLFEPAA